MNRPTRVIQATWFAMVVLQAIGTIDAKHKLPAPKQFVAISTLWGILFLAADTGVGKLAARLSLLLLLTATVIGPFGKRFVGFMQMIAKNFAISPQTGTVGTAGTRGTASVGPISSIIPGPAVTAPSVNP